MKEFIGSVEKSNGYYIGRYEASVSSNRKVTVQKGQTVFDGYSESNSLGEYMNPADLQELCLEMYDSQYFRTDLPSSYVWDTALKYIQTFSGTEKYASIKQPSGRTTTGVGSDKILNIYDFGGNYQEATTENAGWASGHTMRGGGGYTPSHREPDYMDMAFRPVLYILY